MYPKVCRVGCYRIRWSWLIAHERSRQVHAAVLKGSNKEVVLKVLKPGVSDVLNADLSFLYVASRVLEFLNPEFKRTSLSAIVGDIRASMMEEVDFFKEARNIEQFQVRRSLPRPDEWLPDVTWAQVGSGYLKCSNILDPLTESCPNDKFAQPLRPRMCCFYFPRFFSQVFLLGDILLVIHNTMLYHVDRGSRSA